MIYVLILSLVCIFPFSDYHYLHPEDLEGVLPLARVAELRFPVVICGNQVGGALGVLQNLVELLSLAMFLAAAHHQIKLLEWRVTISIRVAF